MNIFNKFKSSMSRGLREEVATRDATLYISVLNALPNPDPILRKVGGRIQAYRELSSDWEVFSAIELIDSGLMDLQWEIDPKDAPPEQVEFIEELVKEWSPYSIMTQCINARLFGYQPFETIWQPYDGKWIISDLVSKPPEWFNYSTNNELQFISKTHPQGRVIEDRRKFIVPRNRADYQNPYGEAHYARCFWPVAFKKGGITFLVKFLEKYGMPWLVGKQPRGTGEKETNQLLTKLHQMVADAVAVIPDDSSVEPLNIGGGASNTDSYLKFIHYCDSVINKVILSNELSMGASKQGGSDVRGNAASNMAVSKQVIKKVAGFAEYTINTAIEMMWAVNFGGIPPEISIYEPKDVQKPLAERDQILANSGVQFTKKYYKDNYALADDDFDLRDPNQNPWGAMPLPQPARRLPDPPADPKDEAIDETEEDEFVETQSIAALMKFDLNKLKAKLFKESEESEEKVDRIEQNSLAGLDELDRLIEAATGDDNAEAMQQIMQQVLAPLFELIADAADYEEVLLKLSSIYPEMKTAELEDHLAKAYFIADILARITEQENQEIEE